MIVKGTRQQKIANSLSRISLPPSRRVRIVNQKIYLYKATGAGLSPNINNLRFYDSGFESQGLPVYYDETDTYRMYLSSLISTLTAPPSFQYVFEIKLISSNAKLWSKTNTNSTNINPGFLGNYPKAFLSSAVGTVTISAI